MGLTACDTAGTAVSKSLFRACVQGTTATRTVWPPWVGIPPARRSGGSGGGAFVAARAVRIGQAERRYNGSTRRLGGMANGCSSLHGPLAPGGECGHHQTGTRVIEPIVNGAEDFTEATSAPSRSTSDGEPSV